MSASFPFVGSGDASYFEWAEVLVRFRSVPSPRARKAIEASIPEPLRSGITWKGPALAVASEQGVGRHIRAAYGAKQQREKGVVALATRTQFVQAGTSADARFNAAIEAWLRSAHARSPILVAYRREDAEAGGTRLSEWHDESVTEAKSLVAALAEDPAGGTLDLELAEGLIDAARRAGVKIAAKVPPAIVRAAKLAEAEDEDDEEAAAAAFQARAKAALAKKSKSKPARVDDARLARLTAQLAARFPAFTKQLRALAAKSKVRARPGASAASIAATEKRLGAKLAADHAALLRAFDGAIVGDLVILGTEGGGARGEDEIAAFAVAHFDDPKHVERVWALPIARIGRTQLLVTNRFGKTEKTSAMKGDPGSGVHEMTRDRSTLDSALDLALRKGL